MAAPETKKLQRGKTLPGLPVLEANPKQTDEHLVPVWCGRRKLSGQMALEGKPHNQESAVSSKQGFLAEL